MAKFLSGPPGGRTLPLTPPRLSDLDGGIYGPGASVASTGLNAGRAVIKTANARAAGETWEDLMEYYLVRLSTHVIRLEPMLICRSSTRTAERSTSHTASARYTTKVASTARPAASLQAATARPPSRATSTAPATTSSASRNKSGRATRRTPASPSARPKARPLRRPGTPRSPRGTWEGCTCVGRA